MVYIEKIAYYQNRRDEVPNQELAALLAKENNTEGIAEIVSYLGDKNKSIQSDCLKVLYEIGYIAPKLITKYVDDFLALLDSKNNRMVWGAMIAVSTIAEFVPEKIWPHHDKILTLINTGTAITNVAGVKTFINMAKTGGPYYGYLISDLLNLQKECRDIDFAKRAEEMAVIIRPGNMEEFRSILEARQSSLSKAAQQRLARIIKKLGI